MPVVTDQNYQANMRRLKAFPKALKNKAEAGTKYHAEGVRNTMVEGLRKGNLVQPALSSATLAIRRAIGQQTSEQPLVGHGDGIRSLRVVKTGRGWSLVARGRTKRGTLWMKVWAIQENGAVIPATERLRGYFAVNFGKHLKAGTVLRIPARHPFRKAVNRYLKRQAKVQTNRRIEKELRSLVTKK